MTVCKRTELAGLLQKSPELAQLPCFLLYGERFLCRQTCDELIAHLLANQPGTVHTIDGDEEDPQQTLGRLISFSLLPGLQIYRVNDSRLFASPKKGTDIWSKVEKAYQAGNHSRCSRLLATMLQAGGLDPSEPPALAEMSASSWEQNFGFSRPAGDLSWTTSLLAAAAGAGKISATDFAAQHVELLKKGLPGQNRLILTTESVDKRKALFTYLKKNGLIIDCSVDPGGSSAAQTAQKEVIRELMAKVLREMGKRIEPKAVDIFLERVGFHPVAVVTETEKLCHFAGERENISVEDLEKMVSNSREGALFELTDAFGKRQTGRSLVILSRLLDQGIHGLAILATMRNFLRKMLILKCIQLQPEHRWQQGMTAKQFQGRYLQDLKGAGRWEEHLGGHPYALYMNFSRASSYSVNGLKRWLELLLNAEFRLKGSPVPQHLVLEELFLAMLKGVPRQPNNPSHSVY